MTEEIFETTAVSSLIDDLNKKYSTELAELVEMTFGAKPDDELQRLNNVELREMGPFGLRLLCKYHRWETAEKNDRMFREHTDETNRIFTIPFPRQPTTHQDLRVIVDQMIDEAKKSYLKGFE